MVSLVLTDWAFAPNKERTVLFISGYLPNDQTHVYRIEYDRDSGIAFRTSTPPATVN